MEFFEEALQKGKLALADANESNFGTNNEKGTGLGLFLIKNFAKIINAKVKVNKAKEETGTVFKLILPLPV